MGNIEINIAKDFSRCPSARYRTEGDYSGEEFRETLVAPKLNEAIEKHCQLIIVLDGAAGYSTSFLEESFGGLIRHDNFTLEDLKCIRIISNEDPSYIDDIKSYWEHAAIHSK